FREPERRPGHSLEPRGLGPVDTVTRRGSGDPGRSPAAQGDRKLAGGGGPPDAGCRSGERPRGDRNRRGRPGRLLDRIRGDGGGCGFRGRLAEPGGLSTAEDPISKGEGAALRPMLEGDPGSRRRRPLQPLPAGARGDAVARGGTDRMKSWN